jgi:integrase
VPHPHSRIKIRIARKLPLICGLKGLHPHALPHTAASLAIASGANVKVVQQMLGHKSATMTLDLYGHLFPDQLDEVADRLDAAARAVVYPLCTRAAIIPMSVG